MSFRESRKSSFSTRSSRSGLSKSVTGMSLAGNKKFNSIAHKKTYDKDGIVQDEVNMEATIKIAMRAKAARRPEVVEVNKTKPMGSASSKGPMKIPRIDKSPETYALIKSALEKNILFNDCTEEQLNTVILSMKPRKIAIKTKLIIEGDEGYNFYVVQKGDFEYSKNGMKVGEAHGGDCFGELALLFYAPRAVTVTSVTAAEVWKLDRVTFRQILDSSNEVKNDKMRRALKMCSLFENFKDEDIEQLIDVGHYQSFREGDVIIKKGDKGSFFYVIIAGHVQVTKAGDSETTEVGSDLNDTVFGAGGYFGERALLTGEERGANVIAIEDTDLLVLDKISFDKYLSSLTKILDHNFGMRVLQSVELLSELEHEMFNELCEELRHEEFHPGAEIIKEGEDGKKFYIIKSGKVEVLKDQDDGPPSLVATLGTGCFFGEFALLNDEPRQCSVIAKTEVSLFSLDRANFDRLFGPLKGLKKKAEQRRSHLRVSTVSKSSQTNSQSQKSETSEALKERLFHNSSNLSNLHFSETNLLKRERIQFEDLKFLATLGTGTFGRVKLVLNLKTGNTYAMKVLLKEQIVNYRQQTNVMNEKKVMMQSDHPFILKLYETFKDKDHLYMLLELVQGGELFTLLHTQPKSRLRAPHARFYAACVLDALHYLHKRHIIYRDLKPENCMIDAQGYIRVVDFGFAKVVKQRTYTLCGTPEYLAPELVLQKGHNKAVDYWALGILLFEMLQGQSPFADPKRNEQITICRNIVKMRYDFPKGFPHPAKKLVSSLLKRVPHERLGMALAGAQDIKDHEFFQDTRWEELRRKELAPPWVPQIVDNTDTSNFETYDEEDNVNLAEYQDDGTNWDAKF